jgi:hypothetical protein
MNLMNPKERPPERLAAQMHSSFDLMEGYIKIRTRSVTWLTSVADAAAYAPTPAQHPFELSLVHS